MSELCKTTASPLSVRRARRRRIGPARSAGVCAPNGTGSTSGPTEVMMRHPGREYGIVLSGHLGVAIQFDTYELGPGDSIAFDSTLPHRLWCIGPQPVHAVWFVVGHSPSHQPS